MSTATNGRAREYRVRDHMIEHGWLFLMRAAASKGAADLLMGHPFLGGALVQVGTAKSKRLGPDDRNRLCAAAELIGALPLLATCGPGIPTRFWRVTRDTPTTWDEFPIGDTT